MMIGIGLGVNMMQRGASDAIAAALATRAGIDWRPELYATTLFTDTAGTVAATGPGDVIAVQKSPSKAGLQFQQTILANRPILVRHPKRGRVNELLGSATLATQSVTVTAAQRTLSFTGTGTVTLSGVSTAGPLVGTGVSDRVSLTFTPTAGTLTLTVSGSVTAAQLQLGAAFDSLQTVSANGYDITEPGQADCWGLFHDGTGDSMATAATLDLSGSDKVGVFMGMQKGVVATTRCALELSATANTNNGAFNFFAPQSSPWANYSALSRGDASISGTQLATSTSDFPAGSYDVIAALHDIAGDITTLRVDGAVSGTPATGDKGAGNFGNYTLYKGARAGSSLFFSGIDWGGCVISGLTTADAAIIAAIEAQLASNTPGVSLP
jgi:hypothetical protein